MTKFDGKISSSSVINSSVFQGSVIGPSMFNINRTDLKPVTVGNFLDKYADDIYLIVPSSNDHWVHNELQSIQSWAHNNNLKLNQAKSL